MGTSRSWFTEKYTPHDSRSHELKRVLVRTQTRFQEAVLADSYSFGRCLILNDEIQSAEKDEFIYHECLVHPGMMTHPAPRDILILGGGEGATVREILRHPKVRQVTQRDIVASGGLYHAQDMKVGPLTPSYPGSQQNGQGGGVAYSTIDPVVSGQTVEVYYGISGASLPGVHVWYDKFSDTTDHAMNSTIILRRSANQNPGGAP